MIWFLIIFFSEFLNFQRIIIFFLKFFKQLIVIIHQSETFFTFSRRLWKLLLVGCIHCFAFKNFRSFFMRWYIISNCETLIFLEILVLWGIIFILLILYIKASICQLKLIILILIRLILFTSPSSWRFLIIWLLKCGVHRIKWKFNIIL